MNKTEFFQGLGLTPIGTEPEEIMIEGKHAERVALKSVPDNPAPAPASKKKKSGNPNSDNEVVIEQEGVIAKILGGFSDVIARLEKGMEDLVTEVKATTEELVATNGKLSGLEEKIVALEEAKPEPADPEAEAIRIEELVNQKVGKLAEEEAAKAEEAVDEDDRCPKCKANVGFKGLEPQKEYGGKYNMIKYLFGKEPDGKDADGREVIGEFCQCPECGHKEPAGEEAAVSEV